jgi:tetratricopeptide (TPR) repeat protein
MTLRRHAAHRAARLALLAVAAALVACAGPRHLPGDDQPTLTALSTREFALAADTPVAASEEQTIRAYRNFLDAAPAAPQRAEAMRRLGDLEMDRADRVAAAGAGAVPDYQAAIARYTEFLHAHPQDAQLDRVLYQLARAQEQGGELEAALQTLNRLVGEYPGTLHADEAHFRRGELLFAMAQYAPAEAAYAAVLQGGARSPFHERALYMQGWSLFKQGRLEDALTSFFGVLDLRLGGLGAAAREESDLATLRQLTRADRELVLDTFRVVSISLSNLQGAASVARYIDRPVREGYQFRVYQQLGELYIRQDRIKDAADTFALFVRRQPLHAQAPLLQARVIAIYQANGFDTLALQAKEDHVERYGAESEFRRANPSGWRRAQPLVKTHLVELARHHHALAQKSHAAGEVQQAVRWYRELLAAFPDDADAPGSRFLLAELLYEDRRFADSAQEFERVAYRSGAHARAADAGYGALLAYAAQEKAAADTAQRQALQRQSVASSLSFARAFAGDTRAGAVLTRAAEQLYALGEGPRAVGVARQALALQPPPAPELRRTLWTVLAHDAFEHGEFAPAEQAYGEVLALTAERGEAAAGRAEIVERLAASIYKQGEAARGQGDARAAVGHFGRVAELGALPSGSAVRASAQYDAAAALIGLKDWEAAARALEDFRRQQPGHALQAEVAPKLALVYLELDRPAQAAAEFERVAAQSGQAELVRAALWQAAELRHKVAQGAAPRSAPLATAIKAFERYLQQYPQPLEPAIEARWKLAALSRQDHQAARALAWTKEVRQADLAAGEARTARTRTLGGEAALALAEPVLEAYRKVALVEPLQRQLKLKKAKMEEVLRAYAGAAEVGVAEVTTAATFHTAALYQDFGRALIGSARPKRLSKAEVEQYSVMLEEQAFPFEEKAIELHEANARRAGAGLYDEWVQASFAALARLKPARWGKTELGDASLPADVPALQAALQAAPGQARLLNQLGIAQRRQGRFEEARQSYEAAMARDPGAAAPQLNLAILHDLYLGDAARALALYQQCLELAPAEAPQLGKWVAEIKARKPAPHSSQATPTLAGRKDTP